MQQRMKESYRNGLANRLASSLAEAVARLPSKRRWGPVTDATLYGFSCPFSALHVQPSDHDAGLEGVSSVLTILASPMLALMEQETR